ncbi:MAG: twin-arginine translocase TatA/TatE family subunit [Opitutales bacterium]
MTSLLAFIEGIGGTEVMLVMFIVLILFGPDKLPGLARGMGKTIREFKKAASGVEEQFRQAMDEVDEAAKPPVPRGTLAQSLPPPANLPPYIPPVPAPTAESVEAAANAATPVASSPVSSPASTTPAAPPAPPSNPPSAG